MNPHRIIVFVLSLFAGVAMAQPTVVRSHPHGAQRGTEVDIEVTGQRLDEALGLLFADKHVKAVRIKSQDDKVVHATIAVAAEAPLGAHPFRLHTRHGLSGFVTFFVGDAPEVGELEPNDSALEAQHILVGTTVNGRLLRENRDHYVFEAMADIPLCVELQCARLGEELFDTWISIIDPSGEEVFRSEDTPLGRMDPLGTFIPKTTGEYRLELGNWVLDIGEPAPYRLHVSRAMRPIAAFPPGGPLGAELSVRWLGVPGEPTSEIQIPNQRGLAEVFASTAEGSSPTPLTFVAWPHPNFLEGDGAATELQPPIAINGRLSAPQECDQYRFAAKKNQALELRAYARTLRSECDLILRVRHQKGHVLSSADDTNGQLDPLLNFVAPEDGVFTLDVEDHLKRGGPGFVYRIHVSRPERTPSVRIQSPRRQDRSPIAVPRGGRTACVLQVDDPPQNPKAAEIDCVGLPEGVSNSKPVFDQKSGIELPIVFEAKADAPLSAQVASLTQTLKGSTEPLPLPFLHAVPLLRVGNDDPYTVAVASGLSVAVIERIPLEINVDPITTPLVRGAPFELKVRVTRDPGFEKPVALRLLSRPPGFTANEIVLKKDVIEGTITVNVGGSAVEGRWPLVVMASVEVIGEAVVASPLFHAEVTTPYVRVRPGKAWGAPGQRITMPLEIERRKEVVGPFIVEVQNLPKGVRAEPLELPVDATSGALQLEIAPDAAPVRMTDVVLRVRVRTALGDLLHQARGGEIRVDKPAEGADPTPPGERASGTLEKPKT